MIFSAMGGFNIVGPDGKITYWMFSQEYKIATDNIVGVAEDQIGNIWFGCAEGLYQYNLKTDTPIRITKTDGLSSNDITYGFFISDYNELYISNEKTLERVSLDKILNTRLIGELKITAVQINEKNRPLSSNAISLKEKDAKQIYFLFSALNFVRKDKLIYRYKINDQEWHYLGAEPKLTLIKPSSGKYDITIEVGDNLGNWQKKNIVLALNIIPPFYKTNWFLGLLFLSFFMGAHFFNVYLVRQEKEKGELKKRIKDNENKMLRSQMNPHFLFNSLNSINSFIIQNKKKEAERYLTAFSKLMRNILENSRKETISLHQELETIKLYLDLEAVRMENKFDYSIRVAGDIDTHSVQIPPLILQPFLENAIWHGINHKSGTGAIDIDIEYNPRNIEILILTIKDDGVGRNASLRRKQQGNEHQSFGIAITKERLELYASGNIVKITDLFDEFNQPSGTLVTLQIQIQHD